MNKKQEQKLGHVQEISDDFDDEFGKRINDQDLTYEIIEWWYDIIRRQMKYAEEIGKEKQKQEFKKMVEEVFSKTDFPSKKELKEEILKKL